MDNFKETISLDKIKRKEDIFKVSRISFLLWLLATIAGIGISFFFSTETGYQSQIVICVSQILYNTLLLCFGLYLKTLSLKTEAIVAYVFVAIGIVASIVRSYFIYLFESDNTGSLAISLIINISSTLNLSVLVSQTLFGSILSILLINQNNRKILYIQNIGCFFLVNAIIPALGYFFSTGAGILSNRYGIFNGISYISIMYITPILDLLANLLLGINILFFMRKNNKVIYTNLLQKK